MRLVFSLLLTIAIASAAEEKVVRPGVPGVQVKLTELKPVKTFDLGGSPDWMALTEDTLWISNARLHKVQRVDPTKNVVAGEVSFDGAPCSGLATGFGSLWVPVCKKGGGSLARVDLKTGKVTATLPFPPAESEGGITTSQHSVWMVTDKDGTLLQIDPETNQVRNKISVPAGSYNPLFADGAVWVTGNASSELTVVDPKSAKVTAKIAVGKNPRFLTYGEGSVWTLNQGDGSLTRVDTKTRKISATIAAGIPGPGGEICVGAGAVWATVFDIPLTKVDVGTNKVTKQWTGPGGDSVRYGFGSLWLVDLRKGLLWRYQVD